MLRRWLLGGGQHRPRSRLGGCLLWILLLIALLLAASLLFGGFRKGTKAEGPRALTASASMTTPRSLPGLVTPA
jgi:cytochrome c-type biogenesis protein CcmH/NrfF